MATIDVVNSAFQSLFFGDGKWLGILIFIAVIIALLVKWKYSGVLLSPVAFLMAIEYLDQGLGWQALIMFFSLAFMMIFMIKDRRR